MKALRLDNGLNLVLGRYPGKSTGMDLCFNYGSAFEKKGEAGLAHFLEHVFFSGSRKLGKKKPFELVEGAGGELNAFTSKEETHYFSRVQSREFKVPVRVLGECFNDGFFLKKDTGLEKRIILNEIREAWDNPVRKLFDEFIEICLPLPHGRRTIGSEKTVKAISHTKLRRRLKENYSSRNAVIGIASSLPEKEIREGLESAFDLRKGKGNSLKEKKAKPAKAERESTGKTEQAHNCLGFQVMNACHRDFVVLELVEAYLGGGLSSRLVQEIREKRGLSYAVHTHLNAEKSHGVFAVYFSTSPEKAGKAKQIVLRELNALQKREVKRMALARAKKKLIGSKALELENSFYSAKALVEASQYGWPGPEGLAERIRKTTAADIKRVSREFLQPEEYAFASLLPQGKGKK